MSQNSASTPEQADSSHESEDKGLLTPPKQTWTGQQANGSSSPTRFDSDSNSDSSEIMRDAKSLSPEPEIGRYDPGATSVTQNRGPLPAMSPRRSMDPPNRSIFANRSPPTKNMALSPLSTKVRRPEDGTSKHVSFEKRRREDRTSGRHKDGIGSRHEDGIDSRHEDGIGAVSSPNAGGEVHNGDETMNDHDDKDSLFFPQTSEQHTKMKQIQAASGVGSVIYGKSKSSQRKNSYQGIPDIIDEGDDDNENNDDQNDDYENEVDEKKFSGQKISKYLRCTSSAPKHRKKSRRASSPIPKYRNPSKVSKPKPKRLGKFSKTRNGYVQGLDNDTNRRIFELRWDNGMEFNDIATYFNQTSRFREHEKSRNTMWCGANVNNRFNQHAKSYFAERGIPYIQHKDMKRADKKRFNLDKNWKGYISFLVNDFAANHMLPMVLKRFEQSQGHRHGTGDNALFLQEFQKDKTWDLILEKFRQGCRKRKTKFDDMDARDLKCIYARILNDNWINNPILNEGRYKNPGDVYDLEEETAAKGDDEGTDSEDDGESSVDGEDMDYEEDSRGGRERRGRRDGDHRRGREYSNRRRGRESKERGGDMMEVEEDDDSENTRYTDQFDDDDDDECDSI